VGIGVAVGDGAVVGLVDGVGFCVGVGVFCGVVGPGIGLEGSTVGVGVGVVVELGFGVWIGVGLIVGFGDCTSEAKLGRVDIVLVRKKAATIIPTIATANSIVLALDFRACVTLSPLSLYSISRGSRFKFFLFTFEMRHI
jgi:hypothetical protein